MVCTSLHLYLLSWRTCHVTQQSIVIACVSVMCRMPSTRLWRRINWGGDFCTECTGQGNDFELIPTVKMETKHPIEGSLGNEFPSIYKHCGVMTVWSRKTLKKFFDFFLFFFRKMTHCWKIVPKRFIATPINVLYSNFVKIGWRKSVKSCIRCALESESNIRLKPKFEPKKTVDIDVKMTVDGILNSCLVVRS